MVSLTHNKMRVLTGTRESMRESERERVWIRAMSASTSSVHFVCHGGGPDRRKDYNETQQSVRKTNLSRKLDSIHSRRRKVERQQENLLSEKLGNLAAGVGCHLAEKLTVTCTCWPCPYSLDLATLAIGSLWWRNGNQWNVADRGARAGALVSQATERCLNRLGVKVPGQTWAFFQLILTQQC